MHLLVFLRPEDRFLDAARIDQIVQAELPDERSDPTGVLFQTVQSTMIHGPCGIHHPTAPCMVKKAGQSQPVCSKRYPRSFQEETIVQEDGYPLYWRRCSGRTVSMQVRGQSMTLGNQWVVPYNPYLTWKYQAHINVEVCASVQAVKYIHKYIYKGNDRTTVQLQQNTDEVAQYLQGRYIGPSEAVWRLCQDQDPDRGI